jgi:hypothetical protein
MSHDIRSQYSGANPNYHLVYVDQAGLTDQSCLGNGLKNHLRDDLAGIGCGHRPVEL